MHSKEWLFVFVWIDFKEWSIVDIQNQKDKLYDISTNGIPNFSSDFIRADGQVNYW